MSGAEADTIVIGAGIAGLAYAHARRGDVVVLDAADRAGGLVATHEVSDLVVDGRREAPFHVEAGPEALADNAPEVRALFDELDLDVVEADPAARRRYLLHPDGSLEELPMSPKAFLTTRLLSWPGKLRALSEPFRRRGVALDGSIADFVRHRLGDEVLRTFVDPGISGIYAGTADQLSLKAAFPRLRDMAAEHGSLFAAMRAKGRERRRAGEERKPMTLVSVRGGLGQVPAAIAARLGGRLRLGERVTSLVREGDGWRVDAERGGEPTSLRARRVVVAVPAAAAARVVEKASTALSQQLASIVSETVVSVAHLWRRDDVGHALDGFGYLVPSVVGRMHLGTLFSSSIVSERCARDRVLLRTMLGGARRPGQADLTDDELVELVRSETAAPLELRDGAAPLWTRVERWRHALPRYDLEHPARNERIDAALAELPGLDVIGNHRRGVAVNALVASSRDLARRHDEEGAP